MSRLTDIPIRVEPPPRTGGLGGGVSAVLSEIAGLLDRLAAGGGPAAIDLRSLPMSPQDRLELQRALGDGEVKATLDADGISTVSECGFAGVWWVEHRDRHGELIAESIEVALFPPILASAPDEITASAESLRARLQSPPPRAPAQASAHERH